MTHGKHHKSSEKPPNPEDDKLRLATSEDDKSLLPTSAEHGKSDIQREHEFQDRLAAVVELAEERKKKLEKRDAEVGDLELFIEETLKRFIKRLMVPYMDPHIEGDTYSRERVLVQQPKNYLGGKWKTNRLVAEDRRTCRSLKIV